MKPIRVLAKSALTPYITRFIGLRKDARLEAISIVKPFREDAKRSGSVFQLRKNGNSDSDCSLHHGPRHLVHRRNSVCYKRASLLLGCIDLP